MQLKKIAVIGPESTGKSTLCKQLANYYRTFWVPEYAREYLLQHGMKYTSDDLLKIAKGQIESEEKYIEKVTELCSNRDIGLLFIDTNMYVMKVWCEFVFDKCHEFITEQVNKRKYDLYLLCNVDLPWVKDALREYPDLQIRQNLYNIYHRLMQNEKTPWVDIYGNYQERLQKAIQAVDKMIVENTLKTS